MSMDPNIEINRAQAEKEVAALQVLGYLMGWDEEETPSPRQSSSSRDQVRSERPERQGRPSVRTERKFRWERDD